jgi:hypothetical protein
MGNSVVVEEGLAREAPDPLAYTEDNIYTQRKVRRRGTNTVASAAKLNTVSLWARGRQREQIQAKRNAQ